MRDIFLTMSFYIDSLSYLKKSIIQIWYNSYESEAIQCDFWFRPLSYSSDVFAIKKMNMSRDKKVACEYYLTIFKDIPKSERNLLWSKNISSKEFRTIQKGNLHRIFWLPRFCRYARRAIIYLYFRWSTDGLKKPTAHNFVR